MVSLDRRSILSALIGMGLLMMMGNVVAETTAIPWPEQRDVYKQHWLEMLGPFPVEKPPLDAVVQAVDPVDGIDCFYVRFRSEGEDWVTAYLLVPEAAKQQAPAPAMVCIHSTSRGAGKAQTIGTAGRQLGDPWPGPEASRAYGWELARRGYVTLSLDLICDGERVPDGLPIYDSTAFYKQHPDWSAVGKNTWDVMRSVDFLLTQAVVDPKRIGCIGHSLGGHSTLFAAAFDARIAAAISNGGQLSWVRDQDHWSRPKGRKGSVAAYIYIPNFRPYIEDQNLPVPIDFEHLMMLVAPRPLLLMGTEDEAKRDDLTGKSATAAEQYRALGAGDKITIFTYPGKHNYPPTVKRFSFAWLDRWMGHTPAVPTIWPEEGE